jgi:glucokinase/fructokinase
MILQDGEGSRSDVIKEPVPDTYGEFLATIDRMVGDLGVGTLTAVGCGLPGSSDSGRPVFIPALPWLEGQSLQQDLEARLAADVIVGVDGHFTLLAEAIEGAAQGHRSSVLVAVGTGIGGAIMLDGRIWPGYKGTAGSWGWLPVRDALGDGVHGAFERMASGTALSGRAADFGPSMTATELVEAARSGQASAQQVVTDFARVLGDGLAAIASVVDPEIVIIGGGLSTAVDMLRSGIEESLCRWASPATRAVRVEPATLGPSAGVVGALLASQSKEYLWR